MTDRDAFIKSILANPADDTVRLIFADWLDEHGEPERAEFIRLQCQRVTTQADRDRAMSLSRPGWFTDWPPTYCQRAYCQRDGACGDLEIQCSIDNKDGAALILRCGFADEVRCPLDVFLRYAEPLFRSHPITRVVLTDSPTPARRGRHWVAIGGFLPTCNQPVYYAYGTREIAAERQSAACVSLGRKRAGLPALGLAQVTS